jgi:hypothetical protein
LLARVIFPIISTQHRATAKARHSTRAIDHARLRLAMKRMYRFRLLVVFSFVILVGAVVYAARGGSVLSAASHPVNELAVASALGGASRAHVSGLVAEGGSALAGSALGASAGGAFVAPNEFYAQSRARRPVAAPRGNARAAAATQRCAAGDACGTGTSESAVVESGPEDVRDDDAQLRPRFGVAAVGVAAAGGLVAMDQIASSLTNGNDNLSPARWFGLTTHFGDTTSTGLGLQGPWARTHGTPAAPWQPDPCYATGTCAFAPPAPPGQGDPSQTPPGNGPSNNDPSGGNPPNNSSNGDPHDGGPHTGDPSKPPVIVTTTTPEPSSVILLATGLGLIALFQLRRRRVAAGAL